MIRVCAWSGTSITCFQKPYASEIYRSGNGDGGKTLLNGKSRQDFSGGLPTSLYHGHFAKAGSGTRIYVYSLLVPGAGAADNARIASPRSAGRPVK